VQVGHIAVVVLVVLAAVPVGSAQSLPETDNTVTRIDVQATGDAEWSVAVRTRLESDDETRAYRAFQDRVRENRSRYLDPFRDRITGVVATADNRSDRSMAARNFTLTTRIQQVPRRWGVIAYSFVWSGFARTDGDVTVDGESVFGDGLFIARNDTLVISGPADYRVERVDPEPDSRENGTVSWQGQREFDSGAPSVTYTTRQQTGGGWPAIVGPTLLGLALAGYVVYRRHNGAERGGTSDTADGDLTRTDGDRVVEFLAANGGQLKQAAIAEELGWSASKTSRTLSELADEGRVEKLRLGRENVISLSDDE